MADIVNRSIAGYTILGALWLAPAPSNAQAPPAVSVCEEIAQKAVDGDGAVSAAVVCVAVASGKAVGARFDSAAWDAAVWN